MDSEQQINDLKDALRQIMQMVSDRGQPLGPQLKTLLAEVIEHVATRIQEIRQGGVPPIPPQEPNLNQAMPSSNIGAFGYDEKNGRLLVQFLGKHPDPNGPIYAYGGVPKQIFDLFQKGAVPARTNGKNRWGKWWKGKVPSMGASMYTLIKEGGYPYQRLS